MAHSFLSLLFIFTQIFNVRQLRGALEGFSIDELRNLAFNLILNGAASLGAGLDVSVMSHQATYATLKLRKSPFVSLKAASDTRTVHGLSSDSFLRNLASMMDSSLYRFVASILRLNRMSRVSDVNFFNHSSVSTEMRATS
jgi:hypothetical protein